MPPGPLRRSRIWPWLVAGGAVVLTVAVGAVILVARSAGILDRGARGTHAERIPDPCRIYDDLRGQALLREFGAKGTKRVPMGGDHWSLCAYGTSMFPPKDTFQVQLNLYLYGGRTESVGAAASGLHRADMGCLRYQGAAAGNRWQEACEGISKGWVLFAARRGNVIAMINCSAPEVGDDVRAAMRRAADLALNKISWEP
ncbi:hypothetical protein GCM10029978_035190 [Actinoallomurus acanthiterrae]